MGTFSGTCEITESKEDIKLPPHFRRADKSKSPLIIDEKDPKLPVLKVSRSKYLEDDLNNLFKSINIKNSSKSLDLSDKLGLDLLRKNALKKPSGLSSVSCSPRSEITETVTLKKALRGLSISHASEVAAMKRLSKVACSPRVSEAERITSLYRSVVVESKESSPSFHHGMGSMVEISIMPEEKSYSSSNKSPRNLPDARVKSSNQNSRATPRPPVAVPAKAKETAPVQKDINPPLEEKHVILPSLSPPKNVKNNFELIKEVTASTKPTNKVSTNRAGRKGKSQMVSSSGSHNNENRLNKVTINNHRSVKPVLRNRNLAKKKPKQVLTSATFTSDVIEDIDTSKGQMVCQKCQCAMKCVTSTSDQTSLEFRVSNTVADVSSKGMKIGGNSIEANNKNLKLKDKGGEFSQSSKSSLGEYSTSTSASEDSNLSGSSCGNRPHMSKDVRWEAIRCVQTQHNNLGLSHFNLLKKLGCGDIGTVYLAELIGANCLFAIKVMDNDYLARRKKMPRAQTEREILRMLDHPFLPTLYSQFTSDNLSCLLMEYCPGGDLHVLRQKQPERNFPEQSARFYVAEVLLALEYLHMLGVVYRDLKPENILVREDGHIMLTDFDLSLRCSVSPILLKSSSSSILEPARISGPCTGSSCIDPFCNSPSCRVPCFSPRLPKTRKLKAEQKDAKNRSLLQLVAEPTDARSNSFVGTHEYLAPEIIKGEGHGSAVDWWTYGIFLYELLYGKTPFKGAGNEETLANVVLQGLTFPDYPMVSFQARDLIRGLLMKDPENRLGSEKGAAEIKQHPFFEGLNWALIRCATPPELPDGYDYGVTQGNEGKLFELF